MHRHHSLCIRPKKYFIILFRLSTSLVKSKLPTSFLSVHQVLDGSNLCPILWENRVFHQSRGSSKYFPITSHVDRETCEIFWEINQVRLHCSLEQREVGQNYSWLAEAVDWSLLMSAGGWVSLEVSSAGTLVMSCSVSSRFTKQCSVYV